MRQKSSIRVFVSIIAVLFVAACGAPLDDQDVGSVDQAGTAKYVNTAVTINGNAPGNLMAAWKGNSRADLPDAYKKAHIGNKRPYPQRILAAGAYKIDTSSTVVMNQGYVSQLLRGKLKRVVAYLADNGNLFFADVSRYATAVVDTNAAPHTNVKNTVTVNFTVKLRNLPRYSVVGIDAYKGLPLGWPLTNPSVFGKAVNLPAKYPTYLYLKLQKTEKNGKVKDARLGPYTVEIANHNVKYEFVIKKNEYGYLKLAKTNVL